MTNHIFSTPDYSSLNNNSSYDSYYSSDYYGTYPYESTESYNTSTELIDGNSTENAT